jgi:ABC-type nitrate/sulfonate/bicarbonate transport system substrate-binding protein
MVRTCPADDVDTRSKRMIRLLFKFLLLVAALALSAGALAQEKVIFATNAKAQAGQGGFYQALADGTFAKYALSVEIQQGGPEVNNQPLLAAGKVDFLMTVNLPGSDNSGRNSAPTIVVASLFQKAPRSTDLPDPGFSAYAASIETRADTASNKPETVRKFVHASIVGWTNYLYGDNRAANELIKRANPDVTDADLAAAIAVMKKLGLAAGGESAAR